MSPGTCPQCVSDSISYWLQQMCQGRELYYLVANRNRTDSTCVKVYRPCYLHSKRQQKKNAAHWQMRQQMAWFLCQYAYPWSTKCEVCQGSSAAQLHAPPWRRAQTGASSQLSHAPSKISHDANKLLLTAIRSACLTAQWQIRKLS